MTSYDNPVMINNNFFCHKNLRKRIQKRADERGETMSDNYRELLAIALAYEGHRPSQDLSKKVRREIQERADFIVRGSMA